MIFLPNMASIKQNLRNLAPNSQVHEVLEALYVQFIPGCTELLENFHLVDTNLNDVTNLSFYLGLPQDQVALFMMTRDVYQGSINYRQQQGDNFNI